MAPLDSREDWCRLTIALFPASNLCPPHSLPLPVSAESSSVPAAETSRASPQQRSERLLLAQLPPDLTDSLRLARASRGDTLCSPASAVQVEALGVGVEDEWRG